MRAGEPRGGYGSVTPRIVTNDLAGLVRFLRDVFDADGDVRPGMPAELRIGGSVIMVSEAGAERATFPAFLYVYVDDADAVHARALAAGAVEVEAPCDTPYGDRRGMFRDPFGDVFQVAHVLPRPTL